MATQAAISEAAGLVRNSVGPAHFNKACGGWIGIAPFLNRQVIRYFNSLKYSQFSGTRLKGSWTLVNVLLHIGCEILTEK